MSLSVGTRVGPYDVVAPLEAGGLASARVQIDPCELRRSHAEAKEDTASKTIYLVMNWFEELRQKLRGK